MCETDTSRDDTTLTRQGGTEVLHFYMRYILKYIRTDSNSRIFMSMLKNLVDLQKYGEKKISCRRKILFITLTCI